MHISKFYNSEAATKNRGKPRAEASVKQIRRIVRQFLIWCAEQGYVEKIPVPKNEASKGGGVRLPKDEEPSQTEAAEAE